MGSSGQMPEEVLNMKCCLVLNAIVLLGLIGLFPAIPAPGAIGQDEALTLGSEAYVYGYPLVTMEITRRIMTNVKAPDGAHAPMGQFAHMRHYPDATFKDVTAPNADTLY